MFLHHVKGATSHDDVKTIAGTVHDTYKAAACSLGLLTDDKEIEYAMQETWDFGSAKKLRGLFAILLNYGEISKPKEINSLMTCLQTLNMKIQRSQIKMT